MSPDNSCDYIQYHIWRGCLPEVQVTMKPNNQLFSEPSIFGGNSNFDAVNDLCISQGSALTLIRLGGFGQVLVMDVKFLWNSVNQKLLNSVRF